MAIGLTSPVRGTFRIIYTKNRRFARVTQRYTNTDARNRQAGLPSNIANQRVIMVTIVPCKTVRVVVTPPGLVATCANV